MAAHLPAPMVGGVAGSPLDGRDDWERARKRLRGKQRDPDRLRPVHMPWLGDCYRTPSPVRLRTPPPPEETDDGDPLNLWRTPRSSVGATPYPCKYVSHGVDLRGLHPQRECACYIFERGFLQVEHWDGGPNRYPDPVTELPDRVCQIPTDLFGRVLLDRVLWDRSWNTHVGFAALVCPHCGDGFRFWRTHCRTWMKWHFTGLEHVVGIHESDIPTRPVEPPSPGPQNGDLSESD